MLDVIQVFRVWNIFRIRNVIITGCCHDVRKIWWDVIEVHFLIAKGWCILWCRLWLVYPEGCGAVWIGVGNTAGLACDVSHGCTAAYLELDLWTKLYHLMVLLGSFHQRRFYHCLMQHHQHLQTTVLCLMWVWGSDTGFGALMSIALFSWDSHHLNWWTPISGI